LGGRKPAWSPRRSSKTAGAYRFNETLLRGAGNVRPNRPKKKDTKKGLRVGRETFEKDPVSKSIVFSRHVDVNRKAEEKAFKGKNRQRGLRKREKS